MNDGFRRTVLCHRGWPYGTVPNSLKALEVALSQGFGIETDLRDRRDRIVIAHDPGDLDAPDFFTTLAEWRSLGIMEGRPLALNVKSDGLISLISQEEEVALRKTDYFFFDMSFPQFRMYLQHGYRVAQRLSEYEQPYSLDESGKSMQLIWLDNFESMWWETHVDLSEGNLRHDLVVVSPELHGRDPRVVWEWIRSLRREGREIRICTDLPLEYEEFMK